MNDESSMTSSICAQFSVEMIAIRFYLYMQIMHSTESTRNIMLYSIQITCPIIATYKTNSYNQKATPFISGEEEITSTEGTTQGYPTSMPIYTLGSSQLLNITRAYSAKNAVYGNDIGCVENLLVKLGEINPISH